MLEDLTKSTDKGAGSRSLFPLLDALKPVRVCCLFSAFCCCAYFWGFSCNFFYPPHFVSVLLIVDLFPLSFSLSCFYFACLLNVFPDLFIAHQQTDKRRHLLSV